MPGTNREALEAKLEALGSPDPPLAALARTLADALDAGAGLSTAAVSREYRATLGALSDGAGGPDAFDQMLAEMGDAS